MRERLDACISEEQWMGVVTQLGDAAVNGNLNAIQLLLHLRFGKPVVRSHPPAEPPALQTE